MEFKFNINEVFKHPVVEINQSLIPPGFGGDRRALWDTVNKVTEVVNAMGEASAAAQGLTKPITTAERLRNSEHKLYFLVDQNANNGKGAVTGMLKTGSKGLYVFDRDGQHYQVSPPCVLDFYIHESRQRTGLGKKLFEHMLEKEQIAPVHMAIDRPSDKFLGFLNKHYALNSPVKQMNNYVVFDGFFPKQPEDAQNVESSKRTPVRKDSANGLQAYASPIGRYGAHRPPCSMGQIIHNETSTVNKRQEPAGVQSMPVTNCQGIQNSPQLPNPCLTQSVPNIQYGERSLNENCYPNQHYISHEGRLQGQSDMSQLQTSLHNQMKINSQHNIVNYGNIPHQSTIGDSGYGYSPTQSYPDPTNLNLHNVASQQMVRPNAPGVPQTANFQQINQNSEVGRMTQGGNIHRNFNADQTHNLHAHNVMNGQVYQTSEQQNVIAPVQSQQAIQKPLPGEFQAIHNQAQVIQQNPHYVNNILPTQTIPQSPANMLQSQNFHQQPQENIHLATPTSNMPNQTGQMADCLVYPNSESLRAASQSPQPLQTVQSNLNYAPPAMQQQQMSNNQQRMLDGTTPQPPQAVESNFNHTPPIIQQQQMSNNQQRMLDGTTPAAQNYYSNQYQQPSQMVNTSNSAVSKQQDGSSPITQNYPNQYQQPSTMVNNTTTNAVLNQLPQQHSDQIQVQENVYVPAPNTNQNQYQQSPDYNMPIGNASSQLNSQQVSNHNHPQVNASMPAVNSNQNLYQHQPTPAINSALTTSDQMSNIPVNSPPLPHQMYEMRHPPLPLGYQHHQSAMNLQQSVANNQSNVSNVQNVTKWPNQSILDHNLKGVGQFGDSALHNPMTADAQRGVNQSYSVPNVYGNYQNSPQFVTRNDSAQHPVNNDGASRNAKEVTEEGVLKYGYPVQMTKSQVFAKANIVRQPAS